MRLIVADDSALLRDGLVLLLTEAGHQVVAAVGDGPSFVAAAAEFQPDCSIVDVRMPPSNTDEGLRAAITVRQATPGSRIVILSQYVEVSYLDDLLETGAEGIGYLLKDRVSDVADFLSRLEDVAAGGSVIDPSVIGQLVGRRKTQQLLDDLTPRETDVLSLMAEGRTNASIAEALVVSEGAVEKHIQRIFAKLNLSPGEARHRRITAVLTYLGLGR